MKEKGMSQELTFPLLIPARLYRSHWGLTLHPSLRIRILTPSALLLVNTVAHSRKDNDPEASSVGSAGRIEGESSENPCLNLPQYILLLHWLGGPCPVPFIVPRSPCFPPSPSSTKLRLCLPASTSFTLQPTVNHNLSRA